nr:DUF3021 domain-containing protein [uncultured Butyrivibrio sp.]
MELRNKFIIKSLIGFIIGIFIGLFFWFLNFRDYSGTAFVVHLIMSGILGLIAMGGSVAYDIESWGLLKATATHYILVMLDFIIVATVLGWVSSILEMVVFLAGMTIIYVAIWLFESFLWKRTIRKMNEQLKEMQER